MSDLRPLSAVAAALAALCALALTANPAAARRPPLRRAGNPVVQQDGGPTAGGNPAVPQDAASTAGANPVVQQDAGSPYADPFTALGAGSPFCRAPVGAAARRDCHESGSIAHPYPISSYGIDDHVPTGVTRISDNIAAALQKVGEFVWFALVLAVKGVLLLLEWAFSLDLLSSTMGAIRRALQALHSQVLGRPWFLFALSVAGLWGIWRGFVQRRTIETIGGLAATVALMLLALVLISRPADTVGHASKLADEAALGVVAGTSSGSLDRPDESFAAAVEGLFRTTVLRPWAALEFGDARWALAAAKRGSRVTNADVWLSFAANSSQRTALYELQKGAGDGTSATDLIGTVLGAINNPLGAAVALLRLGSHPSVPGPVASYVHKDPSKVRMQEAGGTFPRLALVVLIAIGLCGAILLFLYVGVKLLLASVMSLLLVLLAPVMLLAPAFGDSGRATTVAWTKRLAGALAAKLIYSLLLAILLVASAAIESLAIGWFATWLILIAFWWGALLKRRDLVGFVSAGAAQPHAAAGSSRMLRTFYALRIARLALGSHGARAADTPRRRLPRHRRHPGLPAAAGVTADAPARRDSGQPPTPPTIGTERAAGGAGPLARAAAEGAADGAGGTAAVEMPIDGRAHAAEPRPPNPGVRGAPSGETHSPPSVAAHGTAPGRFAGTDRPPATGATRASAHIPAADEPQRHSTPTAGDAPNRRAGSGGEAIPAAHGPREPASDGASPGVRADDARPRPIDHRDHIAAALARRRPQARDETPRPAGTR